MLGGVGGFYLHAYELALSARLVHSGPGWDGRRLRGWRRRDFREGATVCDHFASCPTPEATQAKFLSPQKGSKAHGPDWETARSCITMQQPPTHPPIRCNSFRLRVQVGQRVTPLFIFGDKYLKAGKGSWTEYAVFAAEDVVPVPDGVSDAAASQLVVNPFTVVAMLRELDAPAGEWVIQSGAGSVLGRMFIQIAKARGLKTISVVRRAELVDELTALGGDAVFVSGVHDIPAEVKALTGGRGCWGGIDSVGADVTPVLTACIRNGGTLLIYGAMGGLTFQGSIVDCLFRDVHIRGFWISPFISAKGVGYCHELAAEVWALFLSGVVTPYSGKTFPLAHAAEAVAESVKAARGGKVLLTM